MIDFFQRDCLGLAGVQFGISSQRLRGPFILIAHYWRKRMKEIRRQPRSLRLRQIKGEFLHLGAAHMRYGKR
jgi:hypothetical protein